MDGSFLAAVASVVVAGIAAFSAIASNKAAARASTLNTNTTSRLDMEREAYIRAREFDTETIKRQSAEIADLRQRNKELEDQVRELNARVADLERGNRTPN